MFVHPGAGPSAPAGRHHVSAFWPNGSEPPSRALRLKRRQHLPPGYVGCQNGQSRATSAPCITSCPAQLPCMPCAVPCERTAAVGDAVHRRPQRPTQLKIACHGSGSDTGSAPLASIAANHAHTRPANTLSETATTRITGRRTRSPFDEKRARPSRHTTLRHRWAPHSRLCVWLLPNRWHLTCACAGDRRNGPGVLRSACSSSSEFCPKPHNGRPLDGAFLRLW